MWIQREGIRARIKRVEVTPGQATALVVVTDRALGLRIGQEVYVFPPSPLFGGPTVSIEVISLGNQVHAWARANGRGEEEEARVYGACRRALMRAAASVARKLARGR